MHDTIRAPAYVLQGTTDKDFAIIINLAAATICQVWNAAQ